MGIKEAQRERCWTAEATTEVECQGLKTAENKDEILLQRIRILFVCLHVEPVFKAAVAGSIRQTQITDRVQMETTMIQEHLHIGRIYKCV